MAKKNAKKKDEKPKETETVNTETKQQHEWEKLKIPFNKKHWGEFYAEVKKNKYWGKKKEFFEWLEKQKEEKKWLK